MFAQQRSPESSNIPNTFQLRKCFRNNKMVRSQKFFDAWNGKWNVASASESYSTSSAPSFRPTVSSSTYATTLEPTPSGTQPKHSTQVIDEMFISAPAITTTMIVPTVILVYLIVFRQRY